MTRRFLTAMAVTIALCGVPLATVHAQVNKDPINAAAPPPPPAADEGDPLYGYLGTAVFAVIVVAAVCKSSRRSI